MIQLHPSIPAGVVFHECPRCKATLRVVGWHLPGMRCLAELECAQCQALFYGDLPSGQGLYTPMLLEQATGVVHDRFQTEWFAGWLRDSFANRTSAPLGLSIRKGRASKKSGRAIVLNCLDTLYGHSLLKLLNAQYYLDAQPDFDLLVIVPASLAWMVPAEAHETWVVDLPLERGTEWNDWLAGEIHRRVEAYDECYLSLAFSHPSLCDFSIERFTKTKPFPLEEWEQRLSRPTVTFIWRDDRCWKDTPAKRSSPLGAFSRRSIDKSAREQERQVFEFATELRREWPELDLAVVGLGTAGDLPTWITDDRSRTIDEATERRWCARYAQSHVVVGVHGSNMLLPSAHAGATVELLPPDRWGNVLQDLVVPKDDGDPRASIFRRRLLPLSTAPGEVAHIVSSILRLDHGMRLLMTRAFCQHGLTENVSRWRFPEQPSKN